jgi:hypothetical protein
MFIPVNLAAQKIALIDRGFKRPIQFADSTTMEHLVEGFFPVYVEDLRTVLQKIDLLISYVHEGSIKEKIGDKVPAGKSVFICSSSGTQKHIFHNIVLSTRTSAFSTSLKLVHFTDSRKRALQKLLIFIDYVKNNLAVADEASRFF